MEIRDEMLGDVDAIQALTVIAFKKDDYNGQPEADIVNALRSSGALSISLVAENSDGILGHVAFSPVTIDCVDKHWFGLGPVSVSPDMQRKGIGKLLIKEGLKRLIEMNASGCVVLGDPHFYTQFGFRPFPNLVYSDVPAEYFMALVFNGSVPSGEVEYHASFST